MRNEISSSKEERKSVLAPSFESGQQRVVKQESRLRAKRCDSSSAVGKTGKTFPALLAAAKVHDIYEQDRKSTRLNSSHTVISYAVFCLKKKKKKKKKK